MLLLAPSPGSALDVIVTGGGLILIGLGAPVIPVAIGVGGYLAWSLMSDFWTYLEHLLKRYCELYNERIDRMNEAAGQDLGIERPPITPYFDRLESER
jgi:hypothetical protein